MMIFKIITVVLAAYVITGIHFVWRDIRADVVRQPAYARDDTIRGRIKPLMIPGLMWLGFTIFACTLPGTRLKHLKRETTSWFLFAVLICSGLYLASV